MTIETYERNDVETIVDSNGILPMNEKPTEQGFDYIKLQVTSIKYLSDHRKHMNQKINQNNNSTEFLYAKNQQPKYLWIVEQQQHIRSQQNQD